MASADAETEFSLTAPSSNGKASDEVTFEQIFDSFYDLYSRKVKRPAALKAWKAIRPQTQETADAIFDGLDRWQQYWTEQQTARDMIPHPATFLNGRQWEDQP